MQTEIATKNAADRKAPPALLKIDPGPRAEQRWIDLRLLKVDDRYQRDTSSRRSQLLIERIAAKFRWARFGVASVVRQGDFYCVVDGQHRVEAARRVAGIKDVPCIILPYGTVQEAAEAFVAINRDRVAVTPFHLFHAEVAAGADEATAIARICKSSGVSVCRYPVPATNMKPGETLAIGIITRLYRSRGERFLARVLKALRHSRGGDTPGAINMQAIRFTADQLELDPGGETLKSAAAGPRLRKCMHCPRQFVSSGSGHRWCGKCRRAEAH